jgi:hypothetical protein
MNFYLNWYGFHICWKVLQLGVLSPMRYFNGLGVDIHNNVRKRRWNVKVVRD